MQPVKLDPRVHLENAGSQVRMVVTVASEMLVDEEEEEGGDEEESKEQKEILEKLEALAPVVQLVLKVQEDNPVNLVPEENPVRQDQLELPV